MNTGRYASAVAIIMLAGATFAACFPSGNERGTAEPEGTAADSIAAQAGDDSSYHQVRIDSILPPEDAATRYTTLTDEDFRRVANELQVEVPAIKAVVLIDTGVCGANELLGAGTA